MHKTAAFLFALSCSVNAADSVELRGVGGPFPEKVYKVWSTAYHKQNPAVSISYQGNSAAEGLEDILDGAVDFASSGAPITERESKKAPGIIHIPSIVAAIALVYNLPGVTKLNLSPDSISGIFLGTVRRWNDSRVAVDNPGVSLPDLPFTILYRAAPISTTQIFTDYLSKISPEWKAKVGSGRMVTWPVGVGMSGGGQALADRVRQTPGAIAPIGLGPALASQLGIAAVKNRSGNFALPNPRAMYNAVEGTSMPADFQASITDPRGRDAYPMASFTYILVRRHHADKQKERALARFLLWAVTDGQAAAAFNDYAPLPNSLVERIKREIETLQPDRSSRQP